jgi:putative hydrolase of the HAD superfamily
VSDAPTVAVADPDAGRLFPPAGVRAVVFDVVGTLVEPAPAVAQAYATAARRRGVEMDVDEIQRRFRAAWRRQEALDAAAVPAFATSRRREAERWRGIVEDVFGKEPPTAAIFADLWTHFGRPDAWRAIPVGSSLMRAAVASGATVALASNFDERLFAIAPVVEPLSAAHRVFASSEIGWRKPALEFFHWIEARLGCAAGDIVLVGDDPELDLAAAARAGWRTHAIA